MSGGLGVVKMDEIREMGRGTADVNSRERVQLIGCNRRSF